MVQLKFLIILGIVMAWGQSLRGHDTTCAFLSVIIYYYFWCKLFSAKLGSLTHSQLLPISTLNHDFKSLVILNLRILCEGEWAMNLIYVALLGNLSLL